jgi:hypothetical protein
MVDFILGLFGDKGEKLLGIIVSIVIIVSLGAYLVREFICPWIRRIRLRSPVKALFVITSIDRYELKYAIQDEEEHFTRELVLPAHTKDLLLHLILTAKLGFTQSHFELSFAANKDTKPLIQYYFHPFIKIGPPATPRERKPGEVPGHYIDYHDNYHIDEIRHKAMGQTTTYAFKISTRDPGLYKLKIGIAAGGVDGSAFLRVRVESPLRTRMRCTIVAHWLGCYIRPRISPQLPVTSGDGERIDRGAPGSCDWGD